MKKLDISYEEQLIKILDRVKLEFENKFTCKEDLEDFLQDVSEYLWKTHVSNQWMYHNSNKINHIYKQYINKHTSVRYDDCEDILIDYEDDYYYIAGLSKCKDILNELLDETPFKRVPSNFVDIIYNNFHISMREIKVLKLRFGLKDNYFHTYEELEKEFNVSRERIRQIEHRALRKLRHSKGRKKLQKYYDIDWEEYDRRQFIEYTKLQLMQQELESSIIV